MADSQNKQHDKHVGKENSKPQEVLSIVEESMEGKSGLSIPLIVVLVLVVLGAFYLMKGRPAQAPVEDEVAATTTAPLTAEDPVVTERAEKVLAGGLNISPDLVKQISLVEKEWPDACLGLAKDGEMCAQVITPGYEVVLEAQNVKYTYRTDKAGNMIRVDRSKIGK